MIPLSTLCQQLLANLTQAQADLIRAQNLLTNLQDSLLSNLQKQAAMRLAPGFNPNDPAYLALRYDAQQLTQQIQGASDAVGNYQRTVDTIRTEQQRAGCLGGGQ